jgi:hypothetical protein
MGPRFSVAIPPLQVLEEVCLNRAACCLRLQRFAKVDFHTNPSTDS